MAKAEKQSRVDENAVTVLERDWTTQEEKKARLKYESMRHQLLIDLRLTTDQTRSLDHAFIGIGILLPP
jgi:hypothetical protein